MSTALRIGPRHEITGAMFGRGGGDAEFSMANKPAWILLVLAVSVSAQSPNSGAPDPHRLGQLIERLVVPIHTAAADPDGGEYGTWAGARDYKVQFDEGFRFVPRRGAAKRSASLQWRTESVQIGETELLVRGRPPIRTHEEFRYQLDHGAVVEAYDVLREGVEQSFVIRERPVAEGTITVTGRVSTELTCGVVPAAHRELLFCEGPDVVIRYGRAFAYDSAGRRTQIATAFDGNRIRLSVPASFVAEAQFPLTIDPLTSPVTFGPSVGVGGLFGIASTVISNLGATPLMLVGYSLASSTTDSDAFVLVTSYDNSTGAFLYTDVTSFWSTEEVKVTMAGGPDVWVVGLKRRFSASVGQRVRAYTQSVADTTMNNGTLFLVPTPPGQEHYRLSMGGSWSADRVLLAFLERPVGFAQGVSRVAGVRINTNTNTLGPVFTIHDPPAFATVRRPAVSAMTASTADWMVGFPTDGPPPFAGDRVQVARVPFGVGTISTAVVKALPAPEFFFDFAPGGISIAGSDERFALAYKVGVGDGRETTKLIRFDGPVASATPAVLCERVIADIPIPVFVLAGVGQMAFDFATRSHWSFGVFGHVFRVGYDGAIVEQAMVPSMPSVAYAVPGAVPEFSVVTSLASSLNGRFFRYPDDAVSSIYGTSCTPGSVVFSSNRCVAGNEFFQPALSGLPADVPVAYVLGFAPSHIDLSGLGAPGCFFEVDPGATIILPTASDGAGHALTTIALPADPLFVGDLYAQWFYIDPATSPPSLRAYFGIKHQVR